MPNIRNKSSRGPCDCPPEGYVLGTDSVAIDIIDGNPAEYGFFTANIGDFGFDRDDTSESTDLRAILGLPDTGVDSNGDITLLYKYGSGIKVSQSASDYHIWKAFRYDCGCSYVDCSTEFTDITSTDVETIPCFLDRFIDEDGELDLSNDHFIAIPVLTLLETQGVEEGSRQDGSIPNFFYTNPVYINTVGRFNGIPSSGTIKNYTDPNGIVYSAKWIINNDILDITFITKDPRIPGVPETGRIVKTGNSTRIYRTGYVSAIRQIIRVFDGGYAIIAQGAKSEIAEFQATFGCGDEYTDNITRYLYNSNILDQVELESGTVLVQEPEDGVEVQWWPSSSGSNGGFILPDAGHHGPVSTIPPPEEI